MADPKRSLKYVRDDHFNDHRSIRISWASFWTSIYTIRSQEIDMFYAGHYIARKNTKLFMQSVSAKNTSFECTVLLVGLARHKYILLQI